MTTTWNWMQSLLGRAKSVPAKKFVARKAPRFVPSVLALEERATPAVNVQGGFEGIRQTDPGVSGSPPDTDVAVGPSAIMETVNTTATLRTKSGALLSNIDLTAMFPPTAATSFLFDPNITYDDNSQRFFLVVMEVDFNNFTSFMHIAVSNTSTPTNFATDFTDKSTINTVQISPIGDVFWADFPRLGFNNDGIFVTNNQFSFITGLFDHTLLTTFKKSTLLDANPATLRFFPKDFTINEFTLVPAEMHNAPVGGPELMLGTIGFGPITGVSTQLQYLAMTNYFSVTPTIVTTRVAVTNFNNSNSPPAIQPFTGIQPNTLNTNDTSILEVAWENGHMAATGNAVVNNFTKVRWYELNAPANGFTPSLIQQGNIDPGTDVSTFLPAINIAQNGDIMLTYMQTSPREFLSVYAAGRTPSDPRGKVETPVRLRAGEGVLLPDFSRTGDFSGVGVDPLNPSTFVVASEYATAAAGNDNWGTWIGIVSLSSPPILNPIKTLNPLRFIYDRATDTYVGTLTMFNTTTTITGTLTLVLTLPDVSVQVVSPGSTRVGNTVTIPVTGPFVQGAPLRVAIRLINPNRFALGSIQLGVITSIS